MSCYTPTPIPVTALLSAAGLTPLQISGNPDVTVKAIRDDARKVQPGDCFVAKKGASLDSHRFLDDAIQAGAAVLVTEEPTGDIAGVTTVCLEDTGGSLGFLAQALYGNPAQEMNICGVTGTNGKTSVACLIHDILTGIGGRAGQIGTLGVKYGQEVFQTSTTTPGPIELAEIFAKMRAHHVEAVSMEVSSHALHQKRIAGIPVQTGALTNISHDHLDYHGSFENYVAAKKLLFTEHVLKTPDSVAIFPAFDPAGREFIADYPGDFLSYTTGEEDCFVRAERAVYSQEGTRFHLVIDGKELDVRSRMIGPFNLANMVCAAACAYTLGVEPGAIAYGLETARPIPGRMERIDMGQPFTVIVDYAHTPDAMTRILRTARRHCANQLIAVFGCGGDRDRAKRELMGRAAGEACDFTIYTNDNPRSEQPERIAEDAMKGVRATASGQRNWQVVLDRDQAIEVALSIAVPGDVVVIAGKGHENWQEINGERHPFDDREVVRKHLSRIVSNYQQNPELNADRKASREV